MKKIEPALSAAQWEQALASNATIKPNGRYEIHTGTTIIELIDPTPTQRIALLNHILPDDHPAKITRAKLYRLQAAADPLMTKDISDFLDGLMSYLAPQPIEWSARYVRHVGTKGDDGMPRVHAEGAPTPNGPWRRLPDNPDGTIAGRTE